MFSWAAKDWRRLAGRMVLLAPVWLVLTGGAADGWLPGLAVLVLAAAVSLLPPAAPAWRWRPLGLCRFIPFFLWHSLRAGLDVARRALHPDLPLAPGLVSHRWRLPPGPARVFFANTVSLLSGTLSVGFGAERLTIHVLDTGRPWQAELVRLERLVDDLFRRVG